MCARQSGNNSVIRPVLKACPHFSPLQSTVNLVCLAKWIELDSISFDPAVRTAMYRIHYQNNHTYKVRGACRVCALVQCKRFSKAYMHQQRSLSPIPRSQDWACGPSAFLYIPKDYLLDYFSRKFYGDIVNCIFLR